MILRELWYKLKSKKFKIMILMSVLLYLVLFMLIKNEFFYSGSQYINKYLNYYIQNYLTGITNDLIFENRVLMYVESDTMNIYSALYLYVVTFNNKIYLLFSILMSIYIFYYISSTFYYDIFNGNSILQIFRIGEKKYLNKTIISNCIYCGLLFLIPRILYFVLLNIFFPNGVSSTHMLADTSFISEKFMYTAYNCSPYLMVGFDLLMSFFYGFIICLISLIIVSIIKNKSLSYIVFIFAIASLSIIPIFNYHVPLIFYSSIYNYFDMLNVSVIEANVYEPIIIITIFSLMLFIITKYILKYKVGKSL